MVRREEIDASWFTRDTALPERLTAGGVVVRVEKGLIWVALVCERDIEGYVLPKGGVDAGESIEMAALREIEEESGLTDLARLGEVAILERHDSKKRFWSIIHYGLYITKQVEGVIKDTENHYGLAWFAIDALPDTMFWPDERVMIASNRKRIVEQVIAWQNRPETKQGRRA
jgi:8-oxo-dGTP pyrophosphatase MutT (NUDIX family)